MTADDRRGTIAGPHTPLTTTEQRVADGIFRNLSYTEIGRELAALARKGAEPVTPRTVRQHVSNIALKLDGLEQMAPRVRIYMWMVTRKLVEPNRDLARRGTTH